MLLHSLEFCACSRDQANVETFSGELDAVLRPDSIRCPCDECPRALSVTFLHIVLLKKAVLSDEAHKPPKEVGDMDETHDKEKSRPHFNF